VGALAARFESWAAAEATPGDPATTQRVHWMLLRLARLAEAHIPVSMWPALEQAERYLSGSLTKAELSDALQDTWAYVTGLSCGVGPADGRAAQIVMACLEDAPEFFGY
jgi:methionine synthase I (cobalamin-dependent)